MTEPDNESQEPTKKAEAAETALSEGRQAFLGFLVRRLGNKADAEDVLQEFCIRVLTRKDQLRDVERMDAWLYSILRSTMNDHFRQWSRRGRLADAYGREPEKWEKDAPEQMAQFCRCVDGLIPALRDADADLIRRIDFGEEERAEVAVHLGLTRGALGVRLHRARAALRDALTGHCGKCCKTGWDDCYCPPVGCESPEGETHCAPQDASA
ncbi:RNA polymerase sigma factor (plasmid) [Pseudohalocynthiibacter aestuariivivens]|jgi:RNA polymerase sigma-70 factor (ECF subfamily)|nr:RNA polymerase sigma factor [Pseudohalocynthiibacter aestuariivivens]QIE47715.1 RNA polymerase sigma factor [Pseudohalocynthiibacter aestuariivivens]